MKRKKRKVPAGVHFLNHPRALVDLMSPESLAMDGRGGKVSKPPARFGARSPWKQQLEAERLRALGASREHRPPGDVAAEQTRSHARQARFGPRP